MIGGTLPPPNRPHRTLREVSPVVNLAPRRRHHRLQHGQDLPPVRLLATCQVHARQGLWQLACPP